MAQSGSITLDHTTGLNGQEQIVVGTPVTFYLRYTNNFGSDVNVANGFRVYSPDGATWSPIVGAHVYNWSLLFAMGSPIAHRSADGSGADSVGFAGLGIASGMPNGFSEVMCSIASGVNDPINAGRHCAWTQAS